MEIKCVVKKGTTHVVVMFQGKNASTTGILFGPMSSYGIHVGYVTELKDL